ncbi:RcnB family protein [Sphingosinicella rhizophila]|uniref:RcnB family protein n=1 Tax=Sphingosinicella rhizophila TaxID=3050082 RepID=A0ABU3Q7J0_9SPHN|nr:RcnB family protein [Sphingosinicella sp. GR2756]MDT9599369.1 RcnB family protein [Sphingosinicella sp. GR2756]
MKKLILAAAAASVAAIPAVPAAAAPFGHNDRGRYEQVRHNDDGQRTMKSSYRQSHRWSKGQRFDRRYARSYRMIDNPRAYRLRDAPRGYRWVRSDNDAVLVAITSGIVGAVLANMFN